MNVSEGSPCTRINSIEAAKVVGQSPAALCVMRKQSRGPKYYKIGGRYYYDVTDLNNWIEDCSVDPEAA